MLSCRHYDVLPSRYCVPSDFLLQAIAAGIRYKPTIDTLGRMHDADSVVRFVLKHASMLTLLGTSAALQSAPLGTVEEAWRAWLPPHPHRGEGEAPLALRIHIGPTLKNFSGIENIKIFFGSHVRKADRIYFDQSQFIDSIRSAFNAKFPFIDHRNYIQALEKSR